jgi:antitoxin (DNA-binding transcriptional repressor) of toxin-antitoxin stability system
MYDEDVTVTADIGTSVLRDLVKHIQEGDEMLLTEGDKPVAKIVSAAVKETQPERGLRLPAGFSGHRPLYTVVTQAELAEEMFSRE